MAEDTMRQLKLEFARGEHAAELAEWLKRTKGNLFDQDILSYPSLRALRSYGPDGSVAYLPMQTVLMLESLAVKEGIEPMQAAQAFRDLVKGAMLTASGDRIKEIYFVCEDENVLKVAEGHGFERLPWAVTRIKL